MGLSIPDMSNILLDYLLDYQKENPQTIFRLRTKNRAQRLVNGQWFLGSNYIFLSFWGLMDANNHTPSIGLVLWAEQDAAKIEIAFGSETDPKRKETYRLIAKNLLRQFQRQEEYSEERINYQFYLAQGKSYIDYLKEFMDIYKPLIDNIIAEQGLTVDFRMPAADFQRSLARILEIRQTSDPNTIKNLQDNESDIDEEGFEAIETSDMEGVVSENERDNKSKKPPFEPKDISIVVEPKTVDNLVQRIRYNEVDMNTEFQRKGNLWSDQVQSRLIESILLRFPLPAFFFDANKEDSWLIVDGLQRLWTIKNFIVDRTLVLEGLEILEHFNGFTFDKLDRGMQRRILEAQVTTYLIQPGTPKEVKYNVFHRINTGGLTLNSMEIRNALNQGIASNFLKEITESALFSQYLRINSRRMEDRELLLRALSFVIVGYEQYETPLSVFLNKAMEKLGSKTVVELAAIKDSFFKSMAVCSKLFGEHLFSRSISSKAQRYKLNSALFEIWVSILMRNPEWHAPILANKSELLKGYKTLLRDEAFVASVVSSTSGEKALKYRYSAISILIKNILK